MPTARLRRNDVPVTPCRERTRSDEVRRTRHGAVRTTYTMPADIALDVVRMHHNGRVYAVAAELVRPHYMTRIKQL